MLSIVSIVGSIEYILLHSYVMWPQSYFCNPFSESPRRSAFLVYNTNNGGLWNWCYSQQCRWEWKPHNTVVVQSRHHLVGKWKTHKKNPKISNSAGYDGHTPFRRSFIFEHTYVETRLENMRLQKIRRSYVESLATWCWMPLGVPVILVVASLACVELLQTFVATTDVVLGVYCRSVLWHWSACVEFVRTCVCWRFSIFLFMFLLQMANFGALEQFVVKAIHMRARQGAKKIQLFP